MGPTILSAAVGAFRLVWRAARTAVCWIVALDVVAAVTSALVLVFAGRVLGQLSDGDMFGEVMPTIVVVGVASAVGLISSVTRGEISGFATEQVAADAVADVLEASTQVPYRLFDSTDFYDKLRRAYESALNQAWLIVEALMGLIRTGIDIIATLVVLVFVAPVLIAIAFVAFLPLWAVSVINSKAMYKFSWALTESDRKRAYIEMVLTDRAAAKEARIFALDRTLGAQHSTIWADRRTKLRRLIMQRIGVTTAGGLVSVAVTTVALGVVAWLTTRGDLTIAEAGVGVLAVRRLSSSVQAASSAADGLNSGRLHLEDFHRFLELARSEVEAQGESGAGLPLPASVKSITLDEVSFSYEGSAVPALDAVSLELRSGEVTAIVGANGSGKSTLMFLLSRLYDPDSGSIRWDGLDIADIDRRAYFTAVAPLFQDFAKYELTARENITLADPTPGQAAEADVARAIDRAGSSGVIDRLPTGLDAQLGRSFDDGTELSIGQWQRLALTRALYRDTPLVVLDEPAASLDALAEVEIIDRMRDLAQDRCVVYVSHRFASVSRADRIIVFESGRVVEDGSHADLADAGGIYASMFNAQAAAFAR